MKSNYTPRKMPRSWFNLPDAERKRLEEMMSETATDMALKEIADKQAELQIKWIQLSCIILHDAFDFDEQKLYQYIANWKNIYKKNSRVVGKDIDMVKQAEWLAAEMSRIFPCSGFPVDFVEKLKEI